MFNNLAHQLRLTYELELLKKRKLQIINSEFEEDGDYIGREIVYSTSSCLNQFDTTVFENIATDAVEDILKRGIVQNVFKVFEDADWGNQYAYYPVAFCTDLYGVCDAVKSIIDSLYDYQACNEEFDICNYLKEHLSVYCFVYEDEHLIATQIY